MSSPPTNLFVCNIGTAPTINNLSQISSSAAEALTTSASAVTTSASAVAATTSPVNPFRFFVRANLQESDAVTSECSICISPIGSGYEGLRLNCGCLFHYGCFTDYLKNIQPSDVNQHEGVVCANHSCAGASSNPFVSKIVLSVEDLRGLAEYRTRSEDAPEGSESAESVLAICDKIQSIMDVHKELKKGTENTDSFSQATTKKCPDCTFRATHYHGHKCHHVSCVQCNQNWCYKCAKKRYGSDSCKCPGSIYCSSDNIELYLELLPFPHDTRCGCVICPG